MNYLQRLWRAELLGLGSLIVTGFICVFFLVVFGITMPGEMQSAIKGALPLFFMICVGGFWPVITYGAPIFACYLSEPAFRLWHLLLVAIFPGLLILATGSLIFGLYVAVGGLLVALVMDRVAILAGILRLGEEDSANPTS